jgi:hypothetical protein
LEFVHVPTLFQSADTVLNPHVFGSGDPTKVDPNDPRDQLRLRPPFHLVSRYREPGKVNVNTIYSPLVWEAISGGLPAPSWNQLVASRRGYGPPDGNLLLPNSGSFAKYTSQVSNPFRGPAGGHLRAPLIGEHELDAPGLAALWPSVEATLLRSATVGRGPLPLPTPSLPQPLFAPATGTEHPARDSIRNPYFRYQGLTRLGATLTTRSNVFAVWITVGYFEVDPVSQSVIEANPGVYPDGFTLGSEVGSDTGNVRRARSFYLIDRTIPVAYEPGEDHNVERAILLRRDIE